MYDHDRIYIPYALAKPLIHEADVLLFRGSAWYSYIIQKMTQSDYSHTGLASWHNGNKKILEILEFHGWQGDGVGTDLDNCIKKHLGLVDIYRPVPCYNKTIFNKANYTSTNIDIYLNAKDVTYTMRKLTGIPYGWWRMWWFVKFYLPGLRLFYNLENLTNDEDRGIIYPVCSTAVSYSFTKNNYDLVKNRNDEWIRPGDLAMSPLLNYMFTLD